MSSARTRPARLLAGARMYARLAGGLRGFLRNQLTLPEAEAIVRRRLAERESNFIRLVERGIFANLASPFRTLFQWAGCELGDLRSTLRAHGLEGTLRSLRAAGVYVTFEEFKGRTPIVRGGRTLQIQPRDFNNPYLRPAYESESGGSTGTPARSTHDLEHLAAEAPHMLLTRHAHGVLNVPTAVWRGILPDPSGIDNILRAACFGSIAEKWFTPFSPRRLMVSAKLRYVAVSYGTVALAHLWRVPLPWPEFVPIDRAIVVARWVAETVKACGACLLLAPVSRALRVAVAAREAGLDLTGATFMIAGEPPTPAKVSGITASGVRCFPTYGLGETGRIGMGCAYPAGVNDLHLMSDAYAVIPYPRQVPGADVDVAAFNITTLLPTTPKLLLNAEIDDYGIIERRACGCPLEGYGFTEHLRDIWSFQKLTSEGVTLVGSEMIHILEDVLPSRFGGTPLDYQLLEEEDEQGFTRLSVVVSPRIALTDEHAVIETISGALQQLNNGARVIWNQAHSLRVRRMEPVWTGRGKLLPLHAMRRSGGGA